LVGSSNLSGCTFYIYDITIYFKFFETTTKKMIVNQTEPAKCQRYYFCL